MVGACRWAGVLVVVGALSVVAFEELRYGLASGRSDFIGTRNTLERYRETHDGSLPETAEEARSLFAEDRARTQFDRGTYRPHVDSVRTRVEIVVLWPRQLGLYRDYRFALALVDDSLRVVYLHADGTIHPDR